MLSTDSEGLRLSSLDSPPLNHSTSSRGKLGDAVEALPVVRSLIPRIDLMMIWV